MGDVGEDFKAHREHNKKRKEGNLKNADTDGWKVHTAYHWSRDLNDKRLDYWPSRNKFQYEGKIITGDVVGFIKNRSKQ